MKRTMLALMLLPLTAMADDEFTPAQRAVIERMLNDRLEGERARIRDEVLAETAKRSMADPEAKRNERNIEEPKIPAASGTGGQTKNGQNPEDVRKQLQDEAVEAFSMPATGLRSAAAPIDIGMAGDGVASRSYKFQVEFNEDKATAAIGVYGTSEKVREATFLRQTAWELALSRPISKDNDGSVDFATLDGLSNGLKLDYTFNWRRTNVDRILDFIVSPEFDALCKRPNHGEGDACSLSQIRTFLGEDSDEYRSLLRRHNRWSIEQSLGFQVGYDAFDFITPQLAKRRESHVGYGSGFDAKFISPSRKWLFALGAKYQRIRESNDEAILCPPDNGIDAVQCISGSLGAPTEATRKLIWGEVRGVYRDFGYSLKVIRDIETDETGVVLPMYFAKNNNGELTGGLRLGWTSEQHFGVGIFVSKPFEP